MLELPRDEVEDRREVSGIGQGRLDVFEGIDPVTFTDSGVNAAVKFVTVSSIPSVLVGGMLDVMTVV